MKPTPERPTPVRILNEVAYWIEVRARGNPTFRSAELAVDYADLEWTAEEWTWAVDGVVRIRSSLVASQPIRLSTLARKGRLLSLAIHESLFDGAAELATHGFFDSDNVPGWDTWIAFRTDARGNERHLLAWVPPSATRRVALGIEANPEACIVWASTSGPGLVAALKSFLGL